MQKIAIYNPSICTTNLGDFIIEEAVVAELKNIFSSPFFIHVPTHEIISKISRKIILDSDFTFVAGTNLLSSNMNKYKQWKISNFDVFYLNSVILVGVGWWQYQNKPNLYTKILLRSILDRKYLHSVRDNYTLEKLKSIGIKNVINTGCPTLWQLTNDYTHEIKCNKSKNVLFTLTDYNKNVQLDQKLFSVLKRNYEKIFFWIQGLGDYEYAKRIMDKDVVFINPCLNALDELLTSRIELDYVGTRLHAGIRAIQHGRRSIIIGIDNRAIEKAKDFNINVIQRDKIYLIESKIQSSFMTDLSIPVKNIEKWKKQFI